MGLRGAWGLWAALSCAVCLLAAGQEAAGGGGEPWRQLIQWENNGRVYSLLNSGAEYVPPGPERPGGARLVLGRGGVRRQAAPVRSASETVRGHTRHPFGFGQVPDNWRDGPLGDGGGAGAAQRARAAGRPRQPSSSSAASAAASSFAYAAAGHAAYPQPPFEQHEAAPRAYDEAYTYYRGGGGGGGVAVAAAGAGALYPFQPRGRYEDYGEEQSPYRAQGFYPERPYAAPQDGLDRRYSHSLYHDAGAVPEHGAVISNDNLQPPVGSQPASGTAYGNQYQPYEAQPPFRALEPYGAVRPDVFVPARSPEVPQAVPDGQARLSVGSVYRPSHGGRGELWGCGGLRGAQGAPGAWNSSSGVFAPKAGGGDVVVRWVRAVGEPAWYGKDALCGEGWRGAYPGVAGRRVGLCLVPGPAASVGLACAMIQGLLCPWSGLVPCPSCYCVHGVD